MAKTIFFSWQADTLTQVGRNFLKEVLDEACKSLALDVAVDESLRDIKVDSDTMGVAGQPPIVETILRKIDAAAVFVADMTFVGKRVDGRPTPNPNVLIEYGWALKGLTHERVICVMNIAYGEPAENALPFNLRHVRWPICYSLSEDASQEYRAKEKKQLAATLKKAILASLATVPVPVAKLPPGFPATKAKDGPARFRKHGEALGFNDDTVEQQDNEVFLSEGSAIWLRLMPVIDKGKRWTSHELKKHMIIGSKMNLAPLLNGEGGYGSIRAEDGIGMYKSIPKSVDKINSVAFAFETGEIWSIDTELLSYYNKELNFMENYYKEGIQNYAQFLQSIGLQPPYRWIAGIVGIKGRHLQYPTQPGYRRISSLGPRCATDVIEAEGRYDGIENIGTALLPFFNKIFEKCGLPRPDYLPR